MDIKNLKVFAAVAEGNSLSAVADTMGLTKSAVSHILSNIEKEVGAELLIRNPRFSRLTECGFEFLCAAKKTIASYEDGIEQINYIKSSATGSLRIGVGSFIEPFIRKACAKLLKENPLLNIEAHVYRANTLNQLLKAGKIDIAFTLNKAYDGEGIVSVPCIPIRIMAVMSKRHRLASCKKVTFDDLCKYDCIMPSEDKRSLDTVGKVMGKDLSLLKRRISINDADAAFNMVEEENYITYTTPQHVINRPNLIVKPIEGLEGEIMSNMHYLADVHLKRSAVMLKDALTDFAIPLLRMMDV